MVAMIGAIGAAAGGLSGALSVAGTVMSVVGALSAAQSQAQAADYNARVADRDAYVADQNRKSAYELADIDAADKRRENRRALSAIRASYGASGLELAGSPLDVLQDSATELELDAQRTEYEGRARGREGGLQMIGFGERAELSRMEGRSARTGSVFAALGNGLSGAGTILSRTA